MRAGRQEGPPPYFNIDPDAAFADLGNPTTTGDFSEIAEACARGRTDLASRGLQEDGQKKLRLFSTWEITKYLIPVAPAHFRRVLKGNPDLPQELRRPKVVPSGSLWTRCCACARISRPKAPRPRNTAPIVPKGSPPR